jgi:hypothetical protein
VLSRSLIGSFDHAVSQSFGLAFTRSWRFPPQP